MQLFVCFDQELYANDQYLKKYTICKEFIVLNGALTITNKFSCGGNYCSTPTHPQYKLGV